jgi:hypothetical protein
MGRDTRAAQAGRGVACGRNYRSIVIGNVRRLAARVFEFALASLAYGSSPVRSLFSAE